MEKQDKKLYLLSGISTSKPIWNSPNKIIASQIPSKQEIFDLTRRSQIWNAIYAFQVQEHDPIYQLHTKMERYCQSNEDSFFDAAHERILLSYKQTI